MPVNSIPTQTRLILRLNTGFDENLNPLFRNRSFSNVKPSASNAHLHELATELGSLQVHTLSTISRADTAELEEA